MGTQLWGLHLAAGSFLAESGSFSFFWLPSGDGLCVTFASYHVVLPYIAMKSTDRELKPLQP